MNAKSILKPFIRLLENIWEMISEKMESLDGILIAPGFGERGIEGKYKAIEYARTHNIPFRICLACNRQL